MIHIHSGILLSHNWEHIRLSSYKVGEPRVYYIEWSKSERERQVSPVNTYIWNLERWYWSTGADIENRLVDTEGEGEGGTNWESFTEAYT